MYVRPQCLISTGYDRNICISHSSAGKTDIEVLRTVENAHDSCITACTYSTELDFVATGDDSGCIHVYDFQKLYLLFRCEGHRHEIRSLHFHCQAPLLISGDSGGAVYIWQATGVVYTTSPLMRLTLHPSTPEATARQAPRSSALHSSHDHAPPITSICSTLERSQVASSILAACENGEVYSWDFRMVVNVARKRAIATHFEYQYQANGQASVLQKEEYNPLLRVAHKQSVLKLRPEDRNGVKSRLANSTHIGGVHTYGHSGIVSCASTFSWSAHDDVVFAVKCVPDPGVVYTFSQDSKIKVWDAVHSCIGCISMSATDVQSPKTTATSSAAKQAVSGKPSAATQENQPQASSSSAWKFTHHLSSDASHRHSRIATEVIRKYKRRKLKAQKRGGISRKNAEVDGDPTGDYADVSRMSHLTSEPSNSPAKPPGKLSGIEAALAGQLPFSSEYCFSLFFPRPPKAVAYLLVPCLLASSLTRFGCCI